MTINGKIVYFNFARLRPDIPYQETRYGYACQAADLTGPYPLIEYRVRTASRSYINGEIVYSGIPAEETLPHYLTLGKRGAFNGKSRPKPVEKPGPIPEPRPVEKPVEPKPADIPEPPKPAEPKPTIEPAASDLASRILAVLKAGVPLMLYGPSGTGKTYIAMQVMNDPLVIAVNKETKLSELRGYKSATGEYIKTPFREAVDAGRDIIIDEADTNAEILLSFNSAMSNNVILFPDKMVGFKSRLILTANTNGKGGKDGFIREALDVSTLKRLAVIFVDYDTTIEKSILPEYSNQLWTIRENIKNHGIRHAGVSTRDFVYVKKLLDSGISFLDAVDLTIVQGESAEIKAKMLRGVV